MLVKERPSDKPMGTDLAHGVALPAPKGKEKEVLETEGGKTIYLQWRGQVFPNSCFKAVLSCSKAGT